MFFYFPNGFETIISRLREADRGINQSIANSMIIGVELIISTLLPYFGDLS